MESLNQFVNSFALKSSYWRRDLHHYAESGWVKFHTATLAAEELQQFGYSLALGCEVVNESSRMGLPDELTLQHEFERVRRQGALAQWVAVFEGDFTGIAITLDTGRPGPVMTFRVDTNALDPSEEQDVNYRPYCDGFASCNAGMTYARSYDGHTAIGLGLAHTLKQSESGLHDVIKLTFQPVEEGMRGVRAMVDAGVVDDVDYFTTVYTSTGVSAGTAVCGSDNFMAATKFGAHFIGTVAHAGVKPEDGRDALPAAAQATLVLYAITSHSEGASRVNVGVMQAGSGCNVVPASVLLKAKTRGASDVINQYIFDRAQQVIQGAVTMYGVDVETRLMGAATASSPSS